MEFINTPSLETERLILRKFTEQDIDALFAIYLSLIHIYPEAELDASGAARLLLPGGTDPGSKGVFGCGSHCDFQEGR